MIIKHYLQLLVHHRKLAIRIVLTTTLATLALSLLLLFIMPKYTSTASVAMLPTDPELAFTSSWMGASQYNPTAFMAQTQVEYLISKPVAEMTLQKLAAEMEAMPKPTGLRAAVINGIKSLKLAYYWTFNTLNSGKFVPLTTYEANLVLLRKGVEIEMIEGSFVMQISVTLPDAKLAAKAATYLAESYQDRISEQFSVAGAQLQGFFDQEILRKQEELDDLIAQEIALSKELGLLSIQEQREFIQTSLDAEQAALSAAAVNLAVLDAKLDAYEGQAGTVKLQQVLNQMDQDLALESVQREVLETSIAAYRANIEGLTGELESLAEKEEPLLRLTKQRENAEAALRDLHLKQMQVYLATYSSLSQVREISPAEVPLYPSSPEILVYTVLAFIGGIFIAVFWLVAIDTTTDKVQTFSDLHTIAGRKALGFLGPHAVMQAKGKPWRFFKKKDFLEGCIPDLMHRLGRQGTSPAAPVDVVAFGAEGTGADCAVTMASAFGKEGRQVVCILPAGQPLPRPCCGLEGRVTFANAGAVPDRPGAVYLAVRDDLTPWDRLQAGSGADDVFVCAVAAGALTHSRLEGFLESAAQSPAGRVEFVLVSA
ncbi:MAG: hypothetical protein AB7V45_07600 [Candidatus Krumholzibacteriia bacterium]